MTPGRLEAYLHSDSTTANKAGALVRVTCKTDFAARTDEFIAFAKNAAKFAFAAAADPSVPVTWSDVAQMYPPIEAERSALEGKLRETVTVTDISVLAL